MATVADLRDLVLKKLRRFPLSGSVNANLAADVDARILAKQAEMAGGEDPLAYWGASIVDMPLEAETAFVGLVAGSLAEEKGITPQRIILLLQRVPGHEAVIADLGRVHQSDEPEPALYF